MLQFNSIISAVYANRKRLASSGGSEIAFQLTTSDFAKAFHNPRILKYAAGIGFAPVLSGLASRTAENHLISG